MTDIPQDKAAADGDALPDAFRGMRIVPLTERHAEELCEWRYPPPFDLFNWPAWPDMVEQAIEFGDPRLRESQFAAVVNGRDELIGFAQFFPLRGVTRLGIGMRPDLCGMGAGAAFARLIAEEARRRAPDDEIDLEALTWNTRAIRAYEKAGFVIDDTYWRPTPTGFAEFHCMVCRPPSESPPAADREQDPAPRERTARHP